MTEPTQTRWSEAKDVGLAVIVILISAAAIQVTSRLVEPAPAPIVVTVHIENSHAERPNRKLGND
jgi:hypothetical protein